MATLGKVMGLVKASTARTGKFMGVSAATLSRIMNVGMGVQASGGTISYSGSYTIHKFTADGTLTVATGGGQASGDVEYLVAGGGGGGGGGYEGGGGGAGGYLASASQAVTARAYSITVGGGGNGCTNSPDVAAVSGVASSIQDIVTTNVGGGRGASEVPDGLPQTGGSGGGGGWKDVSYIPGAAGTAGPPIQGYAGGDGFATDGNNIGGGGGGGSSGVGTTATAGVPQPAGGPGTSNSISGGAVTYAAGGKGANRKRNANGANASANTGNGGEAGGNSAGGSTGGNGGSGVVIVRYL